MNTSYKHNITLLFLILASLPAFSQFRMIGTASWMAVTDSTYSGTINFQVDLTGKGYLATSVVDTFRLFTGTEQIYTITTVGTKTFSSAQVTIKEYNGDHGIPIGQVMVYDPAGKTTLPQAPFGSTGSTAQLQAAVDTYNARLLSSAGVDLTPYSTTLEMRQEISDSIATVTGLADGDKGDITVSGSGATWTIDANAVDADNIATNAVGPDEIAPSGVAAASYTAPNITVDQDGRITSATSNTTLVNRAELGDSTAAIRGDMLTGNETITLSGDVTGSGTTAITTTIAAGVVGPTELENTAVTPGAYTNANITVDADGRVTAASSGGGTNFTVYDGTTSENAVDGDTLTFIWDEGITGAVGPKSGGQIDINVKFDGGEAAAETTPSNNNSFLMDDASQNRLEGITWPNLVGAMRDSIPSGASALNDLTDVTISGATTGQVLKYNGASWVNGVDGGGGATDSLFLNVNDYYVSSWSQAAQAAIDTAAAWGGGTVVFPPRSGVYEMDSTGTYGNYGPNHHYCVELKSNVSLIINDTLRLRANLTTNTVLVEMFQGYRIRNIKITGTGMIDMNNSNQPGFTTGYGQDEYAAIYIHQAADTAFHQNSNVEISGIEISNVYGNPYFVKGIDKLVTRDLRFRNVGECGHVDGSKTVLADNIYCDGDAGNGDGVEITGSQDVIVTNCTVRNKGVAYEFHVSKNVRLSNSQAVNCGGFLNSSSSGSEFVDTIFVNDVSSLNCSNARMYLQAKYAYVDGYKAIGGGDWLFEITDKSEEVHITNVFAKDCEGGFLISDNANVKIENASLYRLSAAAFQWQAGTGDTVNVELRNITLDSLSYRVFSTVGTAQVVNVDIVDAYIKNVQSAGGVIIGGDPLTNVNLSFKSYETDTLSAVIPTTDLKAYKVGKFIANSTTIGAGIHNQEIWLVADGLSASGVYALENYLDNGASNMIFPTRPNADYYMAEGEAVKLRYDAYTSKWTMIDEIRKDGVGTTQLFVTGFYVDSIGVNETKQAYYLSPGVGTEFPMFRDAKLIAATAYIDGTSINVTNSLYFRPMDDGVQLWAQPFAAGQNTKSFYPGRHYPNAASSPIAAGSILKMDIISFPSFTNTGQRIRVNLVFEL